MNDIATRGILIQRLVADENSASGMRFEMVPFDEFAKSATDLATLDLLKEQLARNRALEEQARRLTTALENARKDAWLECREEAAKWHDSEAEDYKASLMVEESDSLVRGIYADNMKFHRDSAIEIRSLTPPTEKAMPAGLQNDYALDDHNAKTPTEKAT